MSGQRAKYPLHVRHPANGADDAREVLAIAHLQLEFQSEELFTSRSSSDT